MVAGSERMDIIRRGWKTSSETGHRRKIPIQLVEIDVIKFCALQTFILLDSTYSAADMCALSQ